MLGLIRFVIRLIQRLLVFSQPDVPTMRRRLEWINRRGAMPQGTALKSVRFGTVAVDWINASESRPERVLLYVHGGAGTLGIYSNTRHFLARLCQTAQVRAAAVDYRLAPEHPYPAAWEDVLAAYEYLLANHVQPHNVALMGAGTGAALALRLVQHLRDHGRPLPPCMVLLSPVVDFTLIANSIVANNGKDMTRDLGFVRRSIALYLNNHNPRDPHVSPIFGDLRNLPPTLVQVGSAEMFIDDARALATAAQAAGWSFSYQEVPRMWTSWFLFLPYVPQALQTLREVGAFIRQHVP